MFTTYRVAEMNLEPGEKPTATQLWQYVEQELAWPWLYLQIVRRNSRRANQSMLMLNHAHELRDIIDTQSNAFWVEQVQLVSPPYLNGQSRWLMEPLEEICVVRDGPDGVPGYLYKVANGVSYSMHCSSNRESLVETNVVFSAALHLRHE
jgi:hypothetical protein